MNELQQRDVLRLSNEASQKLSKECLETALFKLMGKEAFERISIADIVKLAGVSRNAFYRNYGTKEALLDSLAETVSVKLSSWVPNYDRATEEDFIRFFQIIVQEEEAFRVLLTAYSTFAEKLTGKTSDYRQLAWKGALAEVSMRWFQNGMNESPEEMGALCYHLLSGLIERKTEQS